MSETVIAGRYELGRRLGIGGMSTVQLALDRRLERNVAVKLLAEHLADDPAFVSRFRREALAAARLVHPNVVQVFDFGFDEAAHQPLHRDGVRRRADRARSCCASEGTSTSRRRSRSSRRPAAGSTTRTATASSTATSSPATCCAADDGDVKLADFGIAKATEQSSITQVGSVLGTAAYLAPEQARGEEAGPRSDLYALGVVAYQLLSGRLPYEATSLSELALKQQRELPAPLDELNADVPPRARAGGRRRARARARRAATRPRRRWSRAIRDGARGIAPARCRRARPPPRACSRPPLPRACRGTAETRALSPRRAADGRRPARPAPPRPAAGARAAPPRRRARLRDARPAPPRRASSRSLAAVAAVGIAGRDRRDRQPRQRRAAAQTSSRTTRSRPSQQLQSLVDDNTKIAAARRRALREPAAARPRPAPRPRPAASVPPRSPRAGRPSAARRRRGCAA